MTDFALDPSLFNSLQIPARPEIISVLFEEMNADEPDLQRVTKHIGADVGLAAAMIKVVNSPAFGRGQKVRSVMQAVSVLGMRNVANVATALAIRQSLGGSSSGGSFHRFWDTAEKVAMICSYLARKLRGIPAEEAFTAGLFHDCGIPVLMARFPHYRETLERANRAAESSFYNVEETEIGTNHGIVGYFLARSWNLHEDLCLAILRHHELGVFESSDTGGMVKNYIGVLHLASHIHHLRLRSTVDLEWVKFESAVLAHFALTGEDFINLVDGAQEELDTELALAA